MSDAEAGNNYEPKEPVQARRAVLTSPIRRELYESLQRLRPELAELYLIALENLSQPLTTQSRVAMVSHCVRDLASNLARAVGASEGIELPERSDTSAPLKRLSAAWDEADLGLLNVKPVDSAESASAESLEAQKPTDSRAHEASSVETVPSSFMDAVRSVVSAHRRGTDNARVIAAALVIGQKDAVKDYAVKAWMDVTGFFRNLAHISHKDTRRLPREDQVREQFELFERLLRSRVGDFFEIVSELDGLLVRANSRNSSGAYLPPDAALLEEVFIRILHPQHRRVFYDRLGNPLWVEALAAKDVFQPPTLIRDAEGYVSSRPWPEGDYLVRAAPGAPEAVASVLQTVVLTDNAFAQRLIVKAASELPAHLAAQFAKPVAKYLKGSYRGLADAPDYVALLVKLLPKHEKQAFALADAMFSPQAVGAKADRPTSRRDVTAGLSESYAYAEALRAVRPSFAGLPDGKGLRRLVMWLKRWQKLSGRYDETAQADDSYIWRPSIAPHGQNSSQEGMGDALVNAVRDLAIEQVASGRPVGDVLADLERNGTPLLRRIAMHTLAVALENEDDGTCLRLSVEHLLEPTFLDGAYRHEYALLARAALPKMDADDQRRFAELVGEGPRWDEARLRSRLASPDREPADVTQAEVTRAKMAWQRDLLAAIGRETLPPQLAARLDALIAAVGAPREHPDFPAFMTSGFVGPTSPMTSDQLAQLSFEELLSYLSTWQPESRPFGFGPSAEGLGRQLSERITKDPASIAPKADQFISLPITYIRSALAGFESAVRNGSAFEWAKVLDLAKYCSEQRDPDSDEDAVASFSEADRVWRFAQQQGASLITHGLEAADPEGIPIDLAPTALAALLPLIDATEPTPEYEEQYGGDNMDPLTLSLNTLRPVTIRALLRFVRWLDEHPKRVGSEATSGSAHEQKEMRDQALAALDRHVGPEKDPSLAVAAVWGEALGSLLAYEKHWIEPRLPLLLGSSAKPDEADSADPHPQGYYDVVWSVVLTVYQPSVFLVDGLRPWFVRRLNDLSSDQIQTVGWRTERSPQQRLADHLLHLKITGQLEKLAGGPSASQELLDLLFQHAKPALISEMLGHIGWQLFQANNVPEGVLRQCEDLWDDRATAAADGRADPAELAGFDWWVRSGKFAPEWWLPRLKQAVSSPGFDTHGGLGDQLAAVASQHPAATLEAFSLLLDRDRGQRWPSYDLMQVAPTVIAAALESGQPSVVSEARSLMGRLGRAGFVDLDKQVRAERERLSEPPAAE
jgi:hypothetical protein